MTIRRAPVHLIGVVVAVALGVVVALAGCARHVEGVAVAGDVRPHDLWQLTDDLVRRSPLSAADLSTMLGIDLTPIGDSGFRGGPADLGPQLTVSSIRMLDIPVLTAILMTLKKPDCVQLADVRAHYPGVRKRASIIQGATVTERWSAAYPWGALSFAFQNPGGCLHSLDVSYPKPRR